jgi:hypothetical protein
VDTLQPLDYYLFELGIETNVPQNRNPSMAYSTQTQEYLVAYEAFVEGQVLSTNTQQNLPIVACKFYKS